MSTSVRDNPDRHRYEIYDGEDLAGFADYRLSGRRVKFVHTEIDDAYGDRGLAKELVTHALDDVRERDLAVQPHCSYVRKVIAENPVEYLDLVPEQDRARFELAEVV